MHKTASLIIALLFGLGASLSQAQVYKWVDTDGVTHYSQQPPENGSAKEMSVPPPAAAPVPAPGAASPQPKSGAESPEASKLSDQIRARRAEQDRTQEQATEQHKIACEGMRKNLETLRTHARVKIEENGATRIMSPEEQAKETIDLEKRIQDNCSTQQ